MRKMREDAYHEERDFFNVRKDARKARRSASLQDRSKYKKTDREKRERLITTIRPEKEAAARSGIVILIRSQDIIVDAEGRCYTCTLRGVLKKERQRLKNLCVVGDRVLFCPKEGDQGVIVAINERVSSLSRSDHLSQRKEHLIAANVDQVCITVSVVDPRLRPPIIDRYVIAAEKGGLKSVIICNKVDLIDAPQYDAGSREQERVILSDCRKMYREAGIPFIETSTVTGVGIDEVQTILKDKISVFSGQSGTGKSSLINLATHLNLRTGRTVGRTRKGAHTTSMAQLLRLPFGGFCVDTPGIRSFGVWDLTEEDVRRYFSEMYREGMHCRFPDCRHQGEPGCQIPEAIECGRVSARRYDSYSALLAGLKEEHRRR